MSSRRGSASPSSANCSESDDTSSPTKGAGDYWSPAVKFEAPAEGAFGVLVDTFRKTPAEFKPGPDRPSVGSFFAIAKLSDKLSIAD